MSESDDLMAKLCEAMRRDFGADESFDVMLGELVGRHRRQHERRMLDAEAARLLPLGREAAAERLQRAQSTVYKMAHRHYASFLRQDGRRRQEPA